VDKIQGPAIIAVRDEVHGWGRNARTCNLYVGALMQVLKFCRDRGKVARLPELKRLKQPKSRGGHSWRTGNSAPCLMHAGRT
jgi:hypothetical protein